MKSIVLMAAVTGVAFFVGGAAGAQEAQKKGGLLGGLASMVMGAPQEKAAAEEPEAAPDDVTTLSSGVEVGGTMTGAPTATNGSLVRCYQLDTARGSTWKIYASQKKRDGQYLSLGVYAGESCDNSPLLPADYKTLYDYGTFGDRYGTSANFAAGGGRYSIGVFSTAAQRMGGFRLTATQTGGAGSSAQVVSNADDLAFARAFGKLTASTAPPKEGGKYSTGDVIKDCDLCPSLVVVPAGQFIMGSTASEEDRNGDEGPAHRVKIANAFAIGQLEVNFEQWDACAKDGACTAAADNGWGRGKRPVINVSWNDARSYVAWLNKKTGERYFLPSEAEWEYAARAGTKTPWNTGSGIVSDDANILNAFKQTVPGGGFPANAFGLKDVHGNVLEWVLDCYEVGYFGVPDDGGAGVTEGCPNRVIRGGSFASEPKLARSATRSAYPVDSKTFSVGFRVARAL